MQRSDHEEKDSLGVSCVLGTVFIVLRGGTVNFKREGLEQGCESLSILQFDSNS